MAQKGITNLSTERPKANAFENAFYVTGVGLGSVLFVGGVKKVFRKEATIGEKVFSALNSILGGLIAVEAGQRLIKQMPFGAYNPALDTALTAGMLASMDF